MRITQLIKVHHSVRKTISLRVRQQQVLPIRLSAGGLGLVELPMNGAFALSRAIAPTSLNFWDPAAASTSSSS